jgi:uncharacterized protein (DUF1810 family)
MTERPNEPTDRWKLERFVDAQASVHERALAELRAGRKQSHWMWFVFPQLAGLGTSAMAERYAISGLDEARAYLAHPILGARLVESAETLLQLEGERSAATIMGYPDDMKLRSSATLFAQVSPPGSVFHRLLDRYFDGRGDERTMSLLQVSKP